MMPLFKNNLLVSGYHNFNGVDQNFVSSLHDKRIRLVEMAMFALSNLL